MLSLGRRGGQRRADPGAQSGARRARPFLWVLFLFSIRHVQNIRVVQIQKDLTFGLCTLSILLHIQQATRPCAAVAGAADALGEVCEFECLERGRLDARTRGSRAISPSEQHLVHKMDKAKMTKK